MRSRELLRNLALSVVVTLLFLGILEGGVRLAGLAPARTLAYPDMETWKAVPGPFEPGQEFVDRMYPRLPHTIRINSLGFRGEEFPLEKAPGTYRILCLGDSYVFGDYVENGETFPAALEAALQGRVRGRDVEVINGGVNGYTITDEADLAREKGFGLEPDLIILGFVLNDLADLTRKVSSRENQRIEARRMSESPLTPVKKILRQTALYNWLFKLKARAMARSGKDPTVPAVPQRHLLEPPYGPEAEELFQRYREELESLAEEARERGIRLLLVLFPFYEQAVHGARADAQERMSLIAHRTGVPVVDLLPSFLELGGEAEALYLMPRNHHPSAEGYLRAAREVSRWIVSAQEGAPGEQP